MERPEGMDEFIGALAYLYELYPFAKDNTLIILADTELLGFKTPRKEWKFKQERCNQCGECCLDVPPNHTPYGADEEGKCNALVKEGEKRICTTGFMKPFACLADPLNIDEIGCSIRYYK
jgi:hypothetical protein